LEKGLAAALLWPLVVARDEPWSCWLPSAPTTLLPLLLLPMLLEWGCSRSESSLPEEELPGAAAGGGGAAA